MAKANVTRKWLAQNYECYGTGYCDLQYLLRYQSKDFYTCGVYGWNFDAYTFGGGYCITTGYRGMIHHVKRNFALDREYDDKARAIQNDRTLSWEVQRDKTTALLLEYLQKIFGTEFTKEDL